MIKGEKREKKENTNENYDKLENKRVFFFILHTTQTFPHSHTEQISGRSRTLLQCITFAIERTDETKKNSTIPTYGNDQNYNIKVQPEMKE